MIFSERIKTLRHKLDTLSSLKKLEEAKLLDAQKLCDETKESVAELEQCDQLLRLLLRFSLDREIKPIEDFVNYGLAKVFVNRTLYFTIRHKETGNGVEYQFWLKEGDSPEDTGEIIKDNVGGSIIQVIGLLLRILTIIRLNLRPFLVLDEYFTGVGDDYRENLILLLRELCNQLSFDILLITHLPEFTANSDIVLRAYSSTEGLKVKVSENDSFSG